MRVELLRKETEAEFEQFMRSHHNGSFMQSLSWPKVKNNWGYDGIISRDSAGAIQGAMLVLLQKAPFFGSSFMYAPRGPVCDLNDRAVVKDLTDGVHALARKHNAYLFKMDPDVLASDEQFIKLTTELGYTYNKGGDNFETIQPRFNYRLNLTGRTEEEIFANLTQKTRYNVRVAMKHNIEVKACGKEMLDEFVRVYKTTGERDGFNTRPKSYFERMMDAMGENCRLYLGLYEGKVISGAISTQYAGKTCYVYGASDNDHRNVMPNYLVQWEMIKWALEGNSTVYDFQGVSGVLDESNHLYGLYRFKRGFNGELVELAGEFDIVFKPISNWLINLGIDVNEKLAKVKKKLRKK
ncbi:Lipid II:glycine glycyltransferase (Peptidoglycan interpeptide bridge formation enzyme) [Acetanaerobacterium elongatum]|uniref:Lipid II:glycine glycyltransferase (Peptidoglycan interpeptide bridge formation enzyme) n=1 Tax=Acetanaerobacterium elongatum TaxID=258515 RepID=A0A1G9YS81_9FIRM|nr:Lipid II:glycine glycyltransferase (Peptidoglycan interpeptide bridge formation enzyme) [Acetanaerobacterium elongatum]